MAGAPHIQDVARFQSMVKRRGHGECWDWTGPHDGGGYGRFADATGNYAAHRVAYNLAHDYVSFGRLRHRCGHRGCVNPRHLIEEDDIPWEPAFHSKVTRGQPEECWEWTGARNGDGYGVLRIGGRAEYAHRLAWELAHRWGEIPIRHRCKNRGCVNPRHLAEGYPDNASKLIEDEVLEIRRRCSGGESQASLARAFRVSPSMVSRIVSRARWKGL